MTEPQSQPLIGYPKSWTPGTGGPVKAEVVYAPMTTEADFEKYRGALAGKIVLTQPPRDVRMLEGRIVLRMSEEDIREAETMPIPAARPTRAEGESDESQPRARSAFQEKLRNFLLSEKIVAAFDRGSDTDLSPGGSDLSWRTQRTDGGTLFVGSGGPRDQNAGKAPPAVTLAVEHYNRLVRILERGIGVKVELEIETRFHDESTMNGFNTIAEIPGSDLADQLVMIGAHLDSTHASTGATDNATGCAAMMEAMRILKATGAKPRRTIRIALWGGEEQGLLGSRAYVREHFGDTRTMQLKPAHEKLSAYFNIDNGTGRILGVWMQGNMAARPVFEEWLGPLKELGVTILSPRTVGSTDHVPFDAIGLPAFQFIQERLEYNSRSHHSNMDFTDRVQREHMIQMATVAAIFAYNAAMSDERMPRKPLPRPSPQRERRP
jgi:hypothetical protein